MSRRNLILSLVVTVILAVGGFFLYRRATTANTSAAANLQTGQVQLGTVVASVNAAGAITAPRTATLAWQTTGIIGQVNVAVGDTVNPGEVLMQLDPKSLGNSVIQAQADLVAAQEALDTLMAGPTLKQSAQAQLNVVQAQQAITTAQKSLTNALSKTASQTLLAAVRDTKVALDAAQANAQLAAVSQTVQDYNGNVWIVDWYWKRYQDAQAKLDANSGSLELKGARDKAWSDWQAQADKQAQRQLTLQTDQASKQNAVAQAQTNYNTALANLQAAQQGASAATVALLQAQLDLAKGNLAQVQTDLATLKASPAPKDIAAAKAKVAAAQAIVDSAKLTAPIGGTVVAVNNHPGDSITSGQTAIVLADLSSLQIQVSVSEVDINSVALSQTVNLTVDAASGKTFQGKVAQVSQMGQSSQGVVTFPVQIVIPKPDSALKPGMTAAVAIVTASHANVLTVPSRAVRATGGQRTVTVLFEGQQIPVPVTVGLSDGSVTEVASNMLKEGDTVLVGQTTATANRTGGGGFGLGGLLGGGFRGGP